MAKESTSPCTLYTGSLFISLALRRAVFPENKYLES